MNGYALNGAMSGLQRGLHTGMAIRNNIDDRERRDRLDVESREYRDWQKGRAEKQDTIRAELNELNKQRLQLGIDQAQGAIDDQRVAKTFGLYQVITTNDDGSLKPMEEVIQNPAFTQLLNETDGLRDLLAAGDKVYKKQPFAGWKKASDLTGNPNDDRYMAVLNRIDGQQGTLTDDRTDNPDANITSFSLDEVRDVIDSYFASHGLSNKVSQKDYRTRKQKIKDAEAADERALGLHQGRVNIDTKAKKDMADFYLEIGLGADGKQKKTTSGGLKSFESWISKLHSLEKKKATIEGGHDPLTGEIFPEGYVDTALATIQKSIDRTERTIGKNFPNEWRTYAQRGTPNPVAPKLMHSRSGQSGVGGNLNQKTLDRNTAMQFLQDAGGDKDLARRMALERGYSF